MLRKKITMVKRSSAIALTYIDFNTKNTPTVTNTVLYKYMYVLPYLLQNLCSVTECIEITDI